MPPRLDRGCTTRESAASDVLSRRLFYKRSSIDGCPRHDEHASQGGGLRLGEAHRGVGLLPEQGPDQDWSLFDRLEARCGRSATRQVRSHFRARESVEARHPPRQRRSHSRIRLERAIHSIAPPVEEFGGGIAVAII